MKKVAVTSAIILALTSIPNLASADLSFLQGMTLNLGSGGTLSADLYTSDTIVNGTPQYNINALSGQFVENKQGGGTTTYTDITLLSTGIQYGNAGNTPTDNKYLTGGSSFLSSGGFAFSYSSDPSDKYQVYYANNQYQGCWSQGGDCIIIITPIFSPSPNPIFTPPTAPQFPVPEPEEWAMMLTGFGMVGWQVKRKQRKAAPAAT